MKLVLATPLYPPDIGGPSFYAQRLGQALTALGHQVTVVNFGAFLRLPSGIRHAACFFALSRAARGYDAIITFDTFSAGVPAVFASWAVGSRLVTRIGGDFLWEQYVNRTHADIPLEAFYTAPRTLTFKEEIIRILTKLVVHHSTVVFSSAYQRDIWQRPYTLRTTHVIENAIAHRETPAVPSKKNFLCFARDIPLKNLSRLREALAIAQKTDPAIVLEDGHVSQEELVVRVKSAYAVVVPSVSEITPNFVLDAIRCGKPFLQTKYSAYATQFKDYGLTIDPFDVRDIAAKLVELAQPATYDALCAYNATHPLTRSYEDIASEFAALLQKP